MREIIQTEPIRSNPLSEIEFQQELEWVLNAKCRATKIEIQYRDGSRIVYQIRDI